MITFFLSLFNVLSLRVLLLCLGLFFIGYTIAPTLYFKKVDFFLKYPLWLNKTLEAWIDQKKSPVFLFIIMFLLNAGFLFVCVFSGEVPVLPMIILVWMGINTGVITYHSLKGKFYFSYLFTPVALLELLAILITFTMAVNQNLMNFNSIYLENFVAPFTGYNEYIQSFVLIVLPLLLLGGALEVSLIIFSDKMDMDEKGPFD